MSTLLRQSLCCTSGALSGFQLRRSFAGVVVRLPPLKRVVVRSEASSSSGGEFEVASAPNQVAPPVGNVFGEEVRKEVGVLEDPVGFLKFRFERKARIAREAFESVEEAVAPSPYSPVQGSDVVVFVCVSVSLVLLFWLGNYVVPTWIFKETVFRNSNGEVEEEENPVVASEMEEVDPADLIELPPNLRQFRGAAVSGFKAGRQRARDAAEKRKKKAQKSSK